MLLLDTCTLLWLVGNPERLSERTRELLQVAQKDSLFISAMSGFEIGLKHRNHQLKLPFPPVEWFTLALERYRITPLAVTWEIAMASVALPRIHNDPSDRMIIATAQFHAMRIITPDPVIHKYPGVKFAW